MITWIIKCDMVRDQPMDLLKYFHGQNLGIFGLYSHSAIN